MLPGDPMSAWPDSRICDLFGIEHPILQAPMAGSAFAALAVAVSAAGGLGSLACAMLAPERLREEIRQIRHGSPRPLNLNFFCHEPADSDPSVEARWKERLQPYYLEWGVDPAKPAPVSRRIPFDVAGCEIVEEFAPEVVSFHFGLPPATLLDRVRATGAKIISSATTVAEACWLEDRGCDAIIAQGLEAGGHRGMFLTDDIAGQTGTMALLPRIVEAVEVPVIAAGGIGDPSGIAAALVLGAAAVQLGTAYLLCPEASLSAVHRQALLGEGRGDTALTNIFSGRPARGIYNRLMREMGPMTADAPPFPLAGGALASLRSSAEMAGVGDFSPLWSGQLPPRYPGLPAGELTRRLAAEALRLLRRV